MKLLDFPLIKFTFFMVLGIIAAYYFHFPLNSILLLSAILILALAIFNFLQRQGKIWSSFFGPLTYLLFFLFGFLLLELHNQRNHANHYLNFVNTDVSEKILSLEVKKKLKPTFYQDKYIVSLNSANEQKVSGTILLNVTRDSTKNTIKIGDILILRSSFSKIKPPLNPGQFNYKNYLKKQNIYRQIFTNHNSIIIKENSRKSIFTFAASIRTRINKELNKHQFKPDELAIINALLLGQREDISPEVYNSYANAGVIHILAVSGLHVGILLLILQFSLKPIGNQKNGKLIKIIIILTVLWGFAIIAGLSASVTRAVTMFSIVAIGINLKRAVNIYNTLAISIFLLLLFKPMFLFDVGFQLSYIAVISIVSIQPLLYKLIAIKNKFLNYFWQLFTVTLAAQIGVLPLSLYYFHQFPGLFFVSNLLIIPVLGIILGFGILILFLAIINQLPGLVAELYGNILSAMNGLVQFIAKQEQFIFKDLSFNYYELIASYIFILSLLILSTLKSTYKYTYTLLGIISIQLIFVWNAAQSPVNELIIFHNTGNSFIGQSMPNQLNIYTEIDSLNYTNFSFLKDIKIKKGIKSIQPKNLSSVYLIKDKILMVVDSLGIYTSKSLKPDILLLRQSPKINLKRVIDSVQPQLIIADGSNYKSYIERWKNTSKNKKIPFHATAEKGAYIFKL